MWIFFMVLSLIPPTPFTYCLFLLQSYWPLLLFLFFSFYSFPFLLSFLECCTLRHSYIIYFFMSSRLRDDLPTPNSQGILDPFSLFYFYSEYESLLEIIYCLFDYVSFVFPWMQALWKNISINNVNTNNNTCATIFHNTFFIELRERETERTSVCCSTHW